MSVVLFVGGLSLAGVVLNAMFSAPPGSHSPLGFGDVGLPFVLALVPLLVYRVLPFGTVLTRCAACGSADVLPADSPKGKELQKAG